MQSLQAHKAKLEHKDQDENKQIKELKDHLEQIQKALKPIKQKLSESQQYMLSEELGTFYDKLKKELPNYQVSVMRGEDDEDDDGDVEDEEMDSSS